MFVKLILILSFQKKNIETHFLDNNLKIKYLKIFSLTFLLVLIKDFSLYYVIYITLLSFLYILIHKEKLRVIETILIISSFIFSYIFLILVNVSLNIDTQSTSIDLNKIFEVITKLNINFNEINSINIFQAELFRIPNKVIEIFKTILGQIERPIS